MARFRGNVGFTNRTETVPGVWSDNIEERPYYGDTVRESVSKAASDKVNADIRLDNRISIVGDAYAFERYTKIKYVVRAGVRWEVTSVDYQHPRLVLSLGGAYHGRLPD